MKNVIQMMCLTAIVTALASAQAMASPSYSLVSQERTINVSTLTGQTSDSGSAAAPDTGLFNESRHAASQWRDDDPMGSGEPFSATADAWQNSTIAPTVLTADLRADAAQQADYGTGEATSLYKIVFDIPASRPATLTVELDINVFDSWTEARVELSGVDLFVLNEASMPFGVGSDTFSITRDYNLAPGQYTFSVEAASTAASGSASGRADTYAQLTIIPEPATLSLLALGGLTVLRRRRK